MEILRINWVKVVKDKIIKLLKKGFFHIFGANVINKIVAFGSSVFLVRILSKEDFGHFSYAQNLLMIFLLFNALGATTGMLQFGSESDNKELRNVYFKFGTKLGISFNLLVSIGILTFGLFGPLQFIEARPLIVSMFALPLVIFIFETIQIYFRTSLRNKEFSFLTTTNTVLIFIFSIIGAYLFQALGVVIFRYVAYVLTIVIGLLMLGNLTKELIATRSLIYKEKIEFIKYSLIQSFNNAISQMLYVIDIFIIGIIVADELSIASYKIATLIPFALNFIPISIMMFIYPYFAKNNKNIQWIKTNYIRLTKYLIILNSLITVFLVVFSSWIITFAFGKDYQDSVAPFVILSIGYFFAASFRIPIGNILAMMRKVKFGLYLSIITGVLNIVLNIILISKYGPIGAAIATLIVFIFTSGLGFWYLLIQFKKIR